MSSGTAWAAAAGAIGGATVSGVVAVLLAFVQRRSLNDQADRQRQSQREQFEAQAAEEHRRWQIQSRRDAYVNCLVSVEKLREMIAPLTERLGGRWPRRDGVAAAEIAELDSLLARFLQRYEEAFAHGQMARLAGPPEMGAAAQHALEAMGLLSNALNERVRCARVNATAPDESAWSSAISDLHAAIESFIAQGSAILGAVPATRGQAHPDRAAAGHLPNGA
jgi:hypothetical protein